MESLSSLLTATEPTSLPLFEVLATTATDRHTLLDQGKSPSVDLGHQYLDQIDKHNNQGAYLNCINSAVPKKRVRTGQRASRGSASQLLVMGLALDPDNMLTDPYFSVPTTAGAYATKDAVARDNADVGQKLSVCLSSISLTRYAYLGGR
ncbi:hypothetical protein B0T21DRAFT_415432 [Apiosordaria backusii]|uniref:Uncharacterized protein n=1 Tax=Apiosordaria backusii TaxID=314023 RepID=A0AA40AJ00_9PEZI|nr:hypothetical protein B0T21DRAFT_415432 [Apiosordaria backusii]